MRYAETGYNLEIDLATGNIERVETDPKLMELHLGGLGTSVKIHWDRVPPRSQSVRPRKPFDIQHRSFMRHTGYQRQPHHCDYHFSADGLHGLSDDGGILGRGTEICGL